MAEPQVTAREGDTGRFLVRNPRTGQIEAHEESDAGRLMAISEYLPVTQEEAQPWLRHRVAQEISTAPEAIALGGQRGLLGGIPELLIDTDSPEGREQLAGIRAIEEGSPGVLLGSEVAGTVAPFLPGLKGVRAATVPGALDALGQGTTTALRGANAGVARTVLSRMAGVGLEGAGQVTIDQVRRAHLSDEPVNAGRVLDAYGLGVMLPALVAGTPIGLGEALSGTLGRRAVGRAQSVKQNVWRPGVSEKDVADIAMREHGVAAPGLLDQFHASNSKSPLLQDPMTWKLMGDRGPSGEQFRRELLEADTLRDSAEAELARHLNSALEVDSFAATNWSGKLKEARVRNWINDDVVTDADAFAFLQDARTGGTIEDLAERAAQQVQRRTEAGGALASALGTDARTTADVVRRGLQSGDENVLRELSRLVRPDDIKTPVWREEALRAIDEYGEIFTALDARGKGHLGEQAGKAKRALELLSGVRDSIAIAPRSKAFAELDWMKKRFADWAKPDQYLGASDDLARNARNAHETFRQMLEDGRYWGEAAATAQRDMNAIFHRRMARKDRFYADWFEDAGVPDPINPWANLKTSTPERVRKTIGDVTDVNHAGIGSYRTHIKETRELIDAAKKHYELTPEEVARLGTQEAGVTAAEDALNRSVYYNLRKNQAEALRQNGVMGYGAGARVVTASLIGGAVGGVPGAVAGAALQGMMNPGSTIYARAVLERMLRQNEGRTARAIEKLLTGKVSTPALGVAQTLSRLSRIVDEPHGEKQEQYKESVKELLAAAQQPEKIEFALQNELGPMAPAMPGVVANGLERVKRGLAYAIEKAPAKPTQTIYGEEISPVGDLEMDVWEREVEAALDPSSILDMAADGELIPEAVDAAEAVAPELVNDLRMEISEAIGEGELEYERGLQLAILFKMPVDATTTPEYIAAQQLVFSAGEQKQQPTDPRSFAETGVHKTANMSEADRLSSGVPPQ